ncbi:glycoside hydrolase family 117 protein [Pelagicoccus mobilis]|uniref:Glycoside hydrolase n=1 Tax=Pelagicoccus mobilis TaxID=415221 RepID=A0A934VQ12_9BACT|nr:hypothetical protein [Pelagicoccus mobilis]MBK1876049.1 hypothetical protein [Pelagicoccus mobilis]
MKFFHFVFSVLCACSLANAKAESAFPARLPEEKPQDRALSSAMHRFYDEWEGKEDYSKELYTAFKYTKLEGFEDIPNFSRRDPTKVIRIDGVYHVWYTGRKTEHAPVGAKATDTIPATDWDLADIWHATSKDGYVWEEQGVAVSRPPEGVYGHRTICTPDILIWEGRYYLYFQAYKDFSYPWGQIYCPVSVAHSDSPYGPWTFVEEPVVWPGEKEDWDNVKINDPYPIVYQDKIYLYYKGAPVERGHEFIKRMQGVVTAESPLGPFLKSPLNPIFNSGHETALFPYREGVAAIVSLDGPEKNTIQWSPDGENFKIVSHVMTPPIAPGAFVPDAFVGNGDGRGITWGLCHINPDGGGATSESILARFDCDLSLDADREYFKRSNLRFGEDTYFNNPFVVGAKLKKQIARDQKKVDTDTLERSQ